MSPKWGDIDPSQIFLEGAKYYYFTLGNNACDGVLLPGPITWARLVEAFNQVITDKCDEFQVLGLSRLNRRFHNVKFPKGTLVGYVLQYSNEGDLFEPRVFTNEPEDEMEDYPYPKVARFPFLSVNEMLQDGKSIPLSIGG